jgi:protein TonB
MDLAVASQIAFSVARHEREARPRSHDERLMSRALGISLLLHIVLLGGGAFVYWFTSSADTVGPRAIDVTLVELSALDTVLPPPQLPPYEPKARAVIPPPEPQPVESVRRVKEERRIAVKEPAKMKSDSRSSQNDQRVTEQPVTNSTASLGGGNEVTQRARVSYHHMVATLLARAKRYPERAVRGGITGSGTVRLTIAADGSVRTTEVAASTQSSVLDDELLRMVGRAAPFPNFPSEMAQSEVTLLVPVSFRLER